MESLHHGCGSSGSVSYAWLLSKPRWHSGTTKRWDSERWAYTPATWLRWRRSDFNKISQVCWKSFLIIIIVKGWKEDHTINISNCVLFHEVFLWELDMSSILLQYGTETQAVGGLWQLQDNKQWITASCSFVMIQGILSDQPTTQVTLWFLIWAHIIEHWCKKSQVSVHCKCCTFSDTGKSSSQRRFSVSCLFQRHSTTINVNYFFFPSPHGVSVVKMSWEG